MELMFLGTGSGVPAKHRNTQSIALKMLNERNEIWLFDCGEATQHQILQTTLKPRKISKIFITHLHGDHIFGLPGLVSSRGFQGGDDPLDIYGPKGIKQYVLMCLKISKSHVNYPIRFHEFEGSKGQLYEDDKMVVSFAKLNHGIDSYGFRMQEKDKTGTLLVDKLQADGIPSGPLYGKLKDGQKVTLEDGREIDGNDYIGKSKKGRIVTILGDTKQTPAIVELAKDADVLVHEGTFAKSDADIARSYNHSTVAQAAEAARDANVKQLYITHISARYLGKDILKLLNSAREIFKQTRIVKDFDEYEVKEIEA